MMIIGCHEHMYTQGFSTLAPLTLWAGYFLKNCRWLFSAFVGYFSSIPGLYALDAGSISPTPICDNRQHCCSWEPLIYNIFFKKIFLLKYSWFTKLWQSLLYSTVTQWYTYRHSFFYILFHYSLSKDIDYSSLCYTVGPYCLLILNMIVCICQSQSPKP